MPDDQRPRLERQPDDATFAPAKVEDPTGAPVRRVKLAIAAAVIVVVAAVGSNVLSAARDAPGIGSAASPSPSSVTSTAAIPSPSPTGSGIDPGRYAIALPQMRIRLTMPAGWSSAESGTAVWKPAPGGQYSDGERPALGVHDVTGVAADICGVGPSRDQFVAIGPTFADMATALANLAELQVSGPTDLLLGGYPARRVVLTLSPDFDSLCGHADGRWLWEDARGSHLGLLQGGTATVYVADVGGDRLVIATNMRGDSVEDREQLDAMIASIEIERAFFPQGELSPSANSLVVDGVPVSFGWPATSWTPGPIEKTADAGRWWGSLYLSKSTGEGQGAEGVIYWTGLPHGRFVDPCASVLRSSVGASAADVASAVSTAPGTELVSGPEDVAVGGRSAKHVGLVVREDLGCDPGYFFAWPSECWGPCWMTTDVGTTIRVWIVDVDGRRMAIVGETHENAGPELGQEIQQIVDSIQFE